MTTTPTRGAADLPEMVSKALREAYNLGQRYWQQADSEYISQHKKADDTRAKFLALVEETCAALAAGQATAAQQGAAYAAQQASAGATLRSMIEGMSVSVDVSTGDHDAGHRYFGTVTEVMECQGNKHGVTLLVQDAEPNFTATPTSGAADLRTAAQAVVDRWDTPLWKDVPATAEYIGRLRAALAAGQATAAQAAVQDDLITIRKPTTSAEMLWLLKLAHLVISDVDKTLEKTFAPAQPAAQQGVAYAALPDEGEPWRGHKFKEVQRGCWRCDCGKTIKEVTSDQSTPASGGNYPVMPKRYTVDDDGEELFTAEKMRAFADATHTLRASHGQAPAPAQPDKPIACSYGDNGYACCEGGPCQADVHNDKLAEQQAPATAQAEESVPAPAPPPECETEAEKRAFAFGWFKALESERMKADNKKKDPL